MVVSGTVTTGVVVVDASVPGETVVPGDIVVLVSGSGTTVVSELAGSTVVLGMTPAPAESSLNFDGRQAPVAGGAKPKDRATAAANTALPSGDKWT